MATINELATSVLVIVDGYTKAKPRLEEPVFSKPNGKGEFTVNLSTVAITVDGIGVIGLAGRNVRYQFSFRAKVGEDGIPSLSCDVIPDNADLNETVVKIDTAVRCRSGETKIVLPTYVVFINNLFSRFS